MKRIKLKQMRDSLNMIWDAANQAVSQDEAKKLRETYRLKLIQYRALRDEVAYVSL